MGINKVAIKMAVVTGAFNFLLLQFDNLKIEHFNSLKKFEKKIIYCSKLIFRYYFIRFIIFGEFTRCAKLN